MASFPPIQNTTVQKTIPSPLYQEFSDDDDLQAFVDSYNKITQEYVDFFNNINLPIYTQSQISGALLDWVANGVYGYPRPRFASPPVDVGEYAQIMYAQVEYAGAFQIQAPVVYTATDDQYKRSLTWHFYKGDGKQFDITWLKRRCTRFLNGPNGIDPGVDQTYGVSVVPSGASMVVTLLSTVGTLPMRKFLAAAINSGNFEMPFQFSFSVIAQ